MALRLESGVIYTVYSILTRLQTLLGCGHINCWEYNIVVLLTDGNLTLCAAGQAAPPKKIK